MLNQLSTHHVWMLLPLVTCTERMFASAIEDGLPLTVGNIVTCAVSMIYTAAPFYHDPFICNFRYNVVGSLLSKNSQLFQKKFKRFCKENKQVYIFDCNSKILFHFTSQIH